MVLIWMNSGYGIPFTPIPVNLSMLTLSHKPRKVSPRFFNWIQCLPFSILTKFSFDNNQRQPTSIDQQNWWTPLEDVNNLLDQQPPLAVDDNLHQEPQSQVDDDLLQEPPQKVNYNIQWYLNTIYVNHIFNWIRLNYHLCLWWSLSITGLSTYHQVCW